MPQNNKEKIAIVLINEYKRLVDRLKKRRMKSASAQIQVVEVSLHGLTEDRPVARKFFERILEYRRGVGGVETFEIPEIEAEPVDEEKATPVSAPTQERLKTGETAVEPEPKKIETEAEESPFEF